MTLKQIEEFALQLSPADRGHLIDRLKASLDRRGPGQPLDLHGLWAGKFPDDFDVEATLREIRSEWTKEWDGGEYVS